MRRNNTDERPCCTIRSLIKVCNASSNTPAWKSLTHECADCGRLSKPPCVCGKNFIEAIHTQAYVWRPWRSR